MTNRMVNFFAFTILTLLWIAFAAALVFNRELLDTVWQSIRGWPLALQGIVGLLVLPVALGLWIWDRSILRSTIIRLLLSYTEEVKVQVTRFLRNKTSPIQNSQPRE